MSNHTHTHTHSTDLTRDDEVSVEQMREDLNSLQEFSDAQQSTIVALRQRRDELEVALNRTRIDWAKMADQAVSWRLVATGLGMVGAVTLVIVVLSSLNY